MSEKEAEAPGKEEGSKVSPVSLLLSSQEKENVDGGRSRSTRLLARVDPGSAEPDHTSQSVDVLDRRRGSPSSSRRRARRGPIGGCQYSVLASVRFEDDGEEERSRDDRKDLERVLFSTCWQTENIATQFMEVYGPLLRRCRRKIPLTNACAPCPHSRMVKQRPPARAPLASRIRLAKEPKQLRPRRRPPCHEQEPACSPLVDLSLPRKWTWEKQ